MPFPVWVVAIRDPAYAYMLRSGGVPRPRGRLPRRRAKPVSTGGYAPIGSPVRQPTVEEIAKLRAQAEAGLRLHIDNVRDVEQRHGEVIRKTAAALMRDGSTTLKTTAGPIEARIFRFPKEAVVLEIHHPGGWGQTRTTFSEVGRQAVRQLAEALVSTRPEAEPLP
jgi:hypothetical protein